MKRTVYTLLLFALITACGGNEEKSKDVAVNEEETALFQEKHRPQFHFTPETAWMNDPNGLVYQNGKYHLFFQHYPDSTVWGPMHWGHAVSEDLVKWEHKPIALFPDSLGYIFSGSAVIDEQNTAGFGENAMIAIFTYHNPKMEQEGRKDYQYQGIAYSLDEGESWSKYEGNPVLPNPGIKDFRDPKVFWDPLTDDWKMILATGDHLQIYSSANMKDWKKESEFHDPASENVGVWECPDLFRLKVEGSDEEKWVLIISHNPGAPNGGSGTRYFIGDYDGKEFTTDQTENTWLDYGTDNYAGVTFNNTPDDRRLFIGWMSNWNYANVTPTEEWRSAMTLARELKLHSTPEGKIYMSSYPVDDFSSITEEKVSNEEIDLQNDYSKKFDFSQAKVSLEFPSNLGDFEIEFLSQGGEKFLIGYNKDASRIYVDRRKSGEKDFSDSFASKVYQMEIDELEEMKLSIYLDRSSVELFINDGRYSMTTQVFPTKPYSEMKLSTGEKTGTATVNISEVKSIW